jgi:hypothetical protein
VQVVDTTKAASRSTLKRLAGGAYREKLPYVFADRGPVGGLAEIMALDHSGDLARLVWGEL